jgi:hypothetical protein
LNSSILSVLFRFVGIGYGWICKLMNNSHTNLETRRRPVAFLYAFVFKSAFSVCVVMLLFTSFLIQPIHQVYADESEPEVESQTSPKAIAKPVALEDDSKADTPQPETEVESVKPTPLPESGADMSPPEISEIDEESPPADSSAVDVETLLTQDDSEILSDADESSTTSSLESLDETRAPPNDGDVGSSTDSGSTSDPPPGPDIFSPTATSTTEGALGAFETSEDVLATSTDVSTAASSSPESVDDAFIASTTLPAVASTTTAAQQTGPGGASVDDVPAADDSADESGAASSDVDTNSSTVSDETLDNGNVNPDVSENVSDEPVTRVETLVTDDNFYQFSKQSCVPVGDGAYHCSDNSEPLIDNQSVVISEVGETGNAEIFIRTAKGKIEQITDNEYDDTAPHYDPDSRRIVWQRLINDRYQIILYDIAEREETQLTFSRTNNMEPAVSKSGVVWQAWDNNDWEIMFFDGEATDQLTNNETQDLAPVLEDEYVIWTVIGDGAQYAQVYSLDSGEIMTISNHEGGSIVNPRFVLVYDTQFDNGDVITQGFDPETGFVESLSAQAAPEPIDLPDPEPIGEIRALIQNKSTTKESGDVVPGDAGASAGDGLSDVDATETSTATTSEDVLNLRQVAATSSLQATDEVAASTSTTSEPVFLELDEFDLVVVLEDEEHIASSTNPLTEAVEVPITASSTKR